MIKHKEQVFKAQYFKDHIFLTSLTINTPHHILIQVKKHNLQVIKAQIKLKNTILIYTINTQFKTPLHAKIQLFIHDVQYN